METDTAMKALGTVTAYELNGSALTVQTLEADVIVTVLAPDLVRIELVPAGLQRQTASFAVVKNDWPDVPVTLTETPNNLKLTTPQVTVEVGRNPLRLRFMAADGRVLAEDAEAGLGLCDGHVQWQLNAPPDAHYYGFGQKLGFLDRRGRAMSLWATDEPLHILDNDELYQAIPFFLTLRSGAGSGEGNSGETTGLFLDCPARVTYDVAKTDPNILVVTAASPVMDAYFFAGPGPKDVIGRYTELTGRMQLPPLWALGYQQCRYSYETADRVREVAAEMRARDIPCDVMYLDIDYMDGYRVFTWDRERFPDPAGLVAELAADGFRTVTIVDPGVKVDGEYDVFRQGVADGHFVCHPDGELFIGTVWPGRTAFPDFLRAGARAWWGDLHREFFQDIGIAGIWIDMNEPSCFAKNTFPDYVMQGEDGAKVPHASVHNAYGQTMAQATDDALRRLLPGKRPFLLTRSGYAGIQRYAAVWMGDNHSWWEHLLMSMPVCLGMGLSGVPFVGTDIGGFQRDSDGELFARWMQMGALMPFCRNHSAKGTIDQEPWSFGPGVEAISREFLQLRYRLLPFLYNEFYASSQTGLPVMRPLLLEYPGDPDALHVADQFLLGRDLLVCPVYQPGATRRMVYLPHGDWVDFWTGERHAGGQHLVAAAPLARLPLYVRDGAIIPMEPPVQHTGQRDGRELILHVYTGTDGSLNLYEDAGDGYGPSSMTPIMLSHAGGVTLTVGEPDGTFQPPRQQVTVHLHTREPATIIRVNGEIMAHATDAAGFVAVTVPTPGAAGFTLTAS